MNQATIFYSWQSWTDQKINRYFIENAIKRAIKRLKKDSELAIEYNLDRDTKGLPGSPAIADAILDKIENCGLFIADLTIITTSDNGKDDFKASPNPNVLLELGYAASCIGWNRIITVMNTAYGNVKQLPFDLQHRRHPIQYELSNGTSEQKGVEEELVKNISDAIKGVLLNNLTKYSLDPKDQRVLNKLERVLFTWDMVLVSFVKDCIIPRKTNPLTQLEHEIKNKNFTFFENPSESYIISIIQLFSASNLEKLSPNYDAIKTWHEDIVETLKYVKDETDSILQKYAHRDEVVVSIVEDIYETSKQLVEIMDLQREYNSITDLWPYPLQDYLRAFLKSYGTILRYNGKISAYEEEDN